MPLIKSRVGLDRLVLAPHVQSPQGAVCMTCGRLVDEESMVEGYPGSTTWAKVLVKHHGAEELRTFDMGSTNWDHTDLATYMRSTNWFDPRGDLGLGVEVAPRDDYEDPEPKKIIVGGS
jgi:hypothetical protein